MATDKKRLRSIYEKTDGYCHLCHKKLSFSNHGKHSAKGAWHIEHSVAKTRGGTDHLNNLYPACIKCNIEKGTSSTQSIRRKKGTTRAPLSKIKKEQLKSNHTTLGAVIGGIIGAPFGPEGTIIGATLGGLLGRSKAPRK
jgi:hypothetical protein